jgi:hypothetical protein
LNSSRSFWVAILPSGDSKATVILSFSPGAGAGPQ